MGAVQLSNQKTVQVGTLRYGSYKRIKQTVIHRLATKAMGLLKGKALDSDAILSILNDLAGELGSVVDELNTEFIVGCTTLTEKEIDDLPVPDIGLLFDSSLEINPLEKFIELEKNSPAGSLVRQLTSGHCEWNAPEAGTSESSASVYDPAGESAS